MSENQRAKRTGRKLKSRKQRDSESVQIPSEKADAASASGEPSRRARNGSEQGASPPTLQLPEPKPKLRNSEDDALDREVDRFLSARQQYMDSVRQLALRTSRSGLPIDPLPPVGPELDTQLYWRSPFQYDPKRVYSLPATSRSLAATYTPRSFPSYATSAPVWAGNPYLPAYLSSPLYDVQPVSHPLPENQQQLYYVPGASTLYVSRSRSPVTLPPLKTQSPHYYLHASGGGGTFDQSSYLVPSVPYNMYETASETSRTGHSLATAVPFSCLNCAVTRNSIDLASRRLDRLDQQLRHHEDALERDLEHLRRKYGKRFEAGDRLSVNSF